MVAGWISVSTTRGNPHFLEINPLAGMHPEHSDLPILAGLNGIPYLELMKMIMDSAVRKVEIIFMNDLLLLINSISEQALEDELDVLVQAEAIERAAKELGHKTRRASFGLNLEPVAEIIKNHPPDLVFNLVETVGGLGALIHLCPSLLDAHGLPYTGSGTYALVSTTDKIRTKQILEDHGIPTPDWLLRGNGRMPSKDKKYILKPIWEDGSAGITDDSIIVGKDIDLKRLSQDGLLKDAFLEEYIDGREFNLSVLAGNKGPEVMPAAEMLYVDYPAGKPRDPELCLQMGRVFI